MFLSSIHSFIHSFRVIAFLSCYVWTQRTKQKDTKQNSIYRGLRELLVERLSSGTKEPVQLLDPIYIVLVALGEEQVWQKQAFALVLFPELMAEFWEE